MAQEHQTVPSNRVSKFAFCHWGNSAYRDKHLAVRTFTIQLQSDTAAAISYGIGDFDRRSVLVGHRENNPAEAVRVTLGGEWIGADFVAALVMLSDRRDGLWFDQLSIPQTPEEIVRHLQNVPDIYATLEVVILLPHSPCPCLEEAMRSFGAGGTSDDTKFDLFRHVVLQCPIAWPSASYFSRFWTKLELRYSCELLISYCSGPAGTCFHQVPDFAVESMKFGHEYCNPSTRNL